jgi:hypothetical protein
MSSTGLNDGSEKHRSSSTVALATRSSRPFPKLELIPLEIGQRGAYTLDVVEARCPG